MLFDAGRLSDTGKLMTMSSLYPCGKPCSTWTHNEKVKKVTLFSAIINGIMMESRLRISNPVGMLLVLQSNQKFRLILL